MASNIAALGSIHRETLHIAGATRAGAEQKISANFPAFDIVCALVSGKVDLQPQRVLPSFDAILT